MAVGLTVKLVLDIKLPGNNVYVLAPFGVIVTLLPLQIVLDDIELKPMVGVAFTVTVLVKLLDEVLKQPKLLVPLIV